MLGGAAAILQSYRKILVMNVWNRLWAFRENTDRHIPSMLLKQLGNRSFDLMTRPEQGAFYLLIIQVLGVQVYIGL